MQACRGRTSQCRSFRVSLRMRVTELNVLRGEQRLQRRSVWHPADLRVSTQDMDGRFSRVLRNEIKHTAIPWGKTYQFMLHITSRKNSVAMEKRQEKQTSKQLEKA